MSPSTSIGTSLLFLFRENERRYAKRQKATSGTPRPYTDEEILSFLAKQFPNARGVKSMLSGSITVNSYRQKMNKGHYFRYSGPITPSSFRYNENGQRVADKTGRRVLTSEDQKKIILDLATLRNRFIRDHNDGIREESTIVA